MEQGDWEHCQNIDSTGVELHFINCQLPGIKTHEERTKEDINVQNNKV